MEVRHLDLDAAVAVDDFSVTLEGERYQLASIALISPLRMQELQRAILGMYEIVEGIEDVTRVESDEVFDAKRQQLSSAVDTIVSVMLPDFPAEDRNKIGFGVIGQLVSFFMEQPAIRASTNGVVKSPDSNDSTVEIPTPGG